LLRPLKYNNTGTRVARSKFKPAAHDACFPAGLLAFSKLLKLHQTEGRISSNLLKRNPAGKQASCAAGFREG